MLQHYSLIINDSCSLWLGDLDSALDQVIDQQMQEFLRTNNIRTVITVAAGLNLKLPGIVHHKIEVLDIETANIQTYFYKALEWIEWGFKVGNVLVHCVAGISRSASIIIAYLIIKKKMSYYQAYTYVKARRPQINPNKGFTEQLMLCASKQQQLHLPPRNTRSNNFQQQQELYGYTPQNISMQSNRKNSAQLIQSEMTFYKSITKSMSQSKKR